MECFGDRLGRAVSRRNSRVVVGIDPVPDRLPLVLLEAARARYGRGGRAVAAALEAFGRLVIEAVSDYAVAVKFQTAFYEQWGPPGLRAMAAGIRAARRADLIVIVDAKRGDIGTTAQAYGGAYLGGARAWGRSFPPPFPADALTVSPYLGSDSLLPLVTAATACGRGLFVLVKTSNPGSGELQDLPLATGGTVAEAVADLVDRLGEKCRGRSGYSAVGAVVGATYPAAVAALRRRLPSAYFLLPGYGAQGAGPADVAAAFDGQGLGALVAASRSVIYAYGDPVTTPPVAAEAVARSAAALRDEVNAALGARPSPPST